MHQYSIGMAERFPKQIGKEGSVLNILVDIEKNQIKLVSGRDEICLDLVCTDELVRTLQNVTSSNEFQSAYSTQAEKLLAQADKDELTAWQLAERVGAHAELWA